MLKIRNAKFTSKATDVLLMQQSVPEPVSKWQQTAVVNLQRVAVCCLSFQPRPTRPSIPPGSVNWVPALAGKAKAGMVYSVCGWMRGVQVKLWDPLRTRAIPECLRGVFTTRRYTNPRSRFHLSFGSKPWCVRRFHSNRGDSSCSCSRVRATRCSWVAQD